MQDPDRTASLMTPAKLAEARPKTPVSPAAWLDRMASDAGHQHVARLAELRSDLQQHEARRDFAPVSEDLSRMAAALQQLDFGLLQQKQGFFARQSGKGKSVVAEFAAQFDRVESAVESFAQQSKLLQGKEQDQASGTDRALVEFEVEFRALEALIDQGARWLQDMRNQLKTREAEAADEESRRQVREDAQRCELLVTRLKLLRALSTAAHQRQQQSQATAARRAALVSALQNNVSGRVKQWRSRVEPLATAAREGQAAGHSLEGPMDCHRDLQMCIKEALADCAQAQSHEKTLVESLDALAAPLQAATS
jgi:hypothetical protein